MSVGLHDLFTDSFARDDLAGAKRWFREWYEVLEQILPGDTQCEYSGRAMAGHISDYLEGYTGEEPASYNGKGWRKSYLDTKYGPSIYFFLWERETGFPKARKVVKWKGRTFVIKQKGTYEPGNQ